MSRERRTDPIVRTYLRVGRRDDGKTVVHARVYSPDYQLDRRGTGETPGQAVRRALADVPRPR
jgi:hypothetical protein